MGKIISQTLPHDLPENWRDVDTVSPNGVEVGLTPQHGYNYLMKLVNAVQKAINELDAACINRAGDSMNNALNFRTVAYVDGVDTDLFHAAVLKAENMANKGNVSLVVFCKDSHVGAEAYIQEAGADGTVLSSNKIIHTGNISTITPKAIGAVSYEEWKQGMLTNASVE